VTAVTVTQQNKEVLMDQTIAQVIELGAGSAEIIDDMAANGYVLVGVVPIRGEFVATARKTLANGQQSFTSQAIGRTKIDAARQLAKAITRA
jgi:hypothetical protein